MKRILICAVMMAVSMFFTGCNSLLTGMTGGGYQDIKWDVMESEDRSEWGKAGLKEGETLAETEAPDFYKMNQESKFDGLEGKQAFRIKEGHSQETEEIETFEVATLLEDGTFIYSYTTREAGTGANRKMVHCVAAYQYDTGSFLTIHENVFVRDEEKKELESFEVQYCKTGDSYNLFVYDNGRGFIYDSTGTLQFETDIETFVRQHFSKAYSVSTTKAITDGNYRIYVELTLEKEQIDFEENPNAEIGEGEEISEEEADKEAEELEEKVDSQTLEVLLLYDFHKTYSTIDQYDLNYDKQVQKWKEAANGKTFTNHPNAESDWNSAVSSIGHNWSGAFLDYIDLSNDDKIVAGAMGVNLSDIRNGGVPLFKWTGNKLFSTSNDGYVCTFEPMLNRSKYEVYRPEAKQKMENVFYMKDGKYYELFGTVGSTWNYYVTESHSRTYTYQWTTTTTDAEGNAKIEVHTQQYTQKITKPRARYTSMSNYYMEGYASDVSLVSVHGAVDGYVLSSFGTLSYWIKDQKSLVSTQIWPYQGDCLFDVVEDGDDVYIVVSYPETAIIYRQKPDDAIAYAQGAAGASYPVSGSWTITSEMLQIDDEEEYGDRELTENDKKYAQAHEALEDKTMGSLANMEGSGYYDIGRILRCNISLDDSLVSQIEALGKNIDDKKVEGDGFLLSTFDKGLLFVRPEENQCVRLDDGTWYGSWRRDDKLVSVGFGMDDVSYSTLDIAYARVHEYDINELYRTMLSEILVETQAEAEEKARQESLEAMTESSTEEVRETTKSSLEQWKEDKAAADATTEAIDLEPLVDSMN